MSMSSQSAPGAPSLQRLIYYSQATAKTAAEVDRELQNIVQASIRHNHDASVTGFLLTHQGWFLQAIEGPKASVTTTFERIAADVRHSGAKVIVSRPAEQRCFASWTLSARKLNDTDKVTLSKFQQHEQFAPPKLTARHALALLMTVSQTEKQTKSILWL